jgi:hypothetical protein
MPTEHGDVLFTCRFIFEYVFASVRLMICLVELRAVLVMVSSGRSGHRLSCRITTERRCRASSVGRLGLGDDGEVLEASHAIPVEVMATDRIDMA